MAHTEKYKDAQGQQKDKTLWIEAAYWTDKTGIAPYLKKGQQVYVEGQPDIRTYTTADGKPGSSLSLRVLSVQLLGGNHGESNNNTTSTPQAAYQKASDITEPLDDLPF